MWSTCSVIADESHDCSNAEEMPLFLDEKKDIRRCLLLSLTVSMDGTTLIENAGHEVVWILTISVAKEMTGKGKRERYYAVKELLILSGLSFLRPSVFIVHPIN